MVIPNIFNPIEMNNLDSGFEVGQLEAPTSYVLNQNLIRYFSTLARPNLIRYNFLVFGNNPPGGVYSGTNVLEQRNHERVYKCYLALDG